MFNNNFNNMATLEEVWGDNFQKPKDKKKRKSKKKPSQKTIEMAIENHNNNPEPMPYDVEDEMGVTDFFLNQNPFQGDYHPEDVFNEPTIVPEKPEEKINYSEREENVVVKSDDTRIDDLEKKIDLIISKLNEIDSEPKQENIHDMILFVIFAIFILFTMDGVYRLGKQTL